jgi:hypothetical protein
MTTETQDAVAGGYSGDTEVFDVNAELDLTNEGFSTPRINWQIIKAEVESPNPGQQRAVVEFAGAHGGIDYSVTDRFWLQYTGSGDASRDAKTTSIGRGQLKRLFIAALGTPKASVSQLMGTWVSAEGQEDDLGFRRLRGLRTAEGGAATGAPAL